MHFAPGGNIRGLEPLAGRPFDVKDYDVPLVLDYPKRPFQSSVVRIVFFEPVIGGPVAFVAGPEFPFHLRASPGNRFADTVQTQAVLAAVARFPRLPYAGSDCRTLVSSRDQRPWASLSVNFLQRAMSEAVNVLSSAAALASLTGSYRPDRSKRWLASGNAPPVPG